MRETIYLAGPVEEHPQPAAWRREAKKNNGNIEWRDPTEFGFDENSDAGVVSEKCKREVRRSDGVLMSYQSGVPTWGTPVEGYIAWEMGIPVVIWTATPHEELPKFLQHHSDFTSNDIKECLRYISRHK